MSTTADQVQQLVQQALGRFEQLSASEQPPTVVLQNMLGTMTQATAAIGGVAWMPAGPNSPRYKSVAACGFAMPDTGNPAPPVADAIAQAFEQRKSIVIAPDSPQFQSTDLHNTTQFFVPIDAASRIFGVIQLIHSPELDPKVYRQYVAFAQQGARAAGTYLARRQTQVLSEEAAGNIALLDATPALLKINSPTDLIHELANTARQLLGAQRAAVIGFWSKRGEVAFSDVIKADHKAVLVRAVEALAEITRQRGVPMTFTRGQPPSEDEAVVEPLLDQIYKSGGAEAICLTPIRDEDRAIAVLMVEYTEPTAASRRAVVQQQLCRQAAPIIVRTAETYNRPLRRTATFIDNIRRRPAASAMRTLIALAIFATVLYALFFLPVEIVVRGDARLEPAKLAQITAPIDGRVAKVLVTSGQTIAEGDILLELDDQPILLELTETEKAIQAERVKLETARDKATRGGGDANSDMRASELQIERLTIHRRAVLRDMESAKVRSPITGVVLTERTQNLLGMTVPKGEQLLRVADLQTFELVAELREEDLALVERSLREGRNVPVTFLSRAWPDSPQKTEIVSLQSLAPTSAPDEYQKQHVFRVTTSIKIEGISQQLVLANPSGRAKFDTGPGSIATRYGRDLWRFLKMTLLF